MTIEAVLQRYDQESARPSLFLAALIDEIRPPRFSPVDHATHALQALCHVLDDDEARAAQLRSAILKLLAGHKPVSLLVDSGIQPSTGFFTELWRRLGHKILPAAVDRRYLKDLFALIFAKASDEHWVAAVPTEVWQRLIVALRFEAGDPALLATCHKNLLDAVEVLSYRISALGLEPELLRNRPELEDHASPFIRQNTELREFLQDATRQGDARPML